MCIRDRAAAAAWGRRAPGTCGSGTATLENARRATSVATATARARRRVDRGRGVIDPMVAQGGDVAADRPSARAPPPGAVVSRLFIATTLTFPDVRRCR